MGNGIHGWIGGPGGSPTEYGLPLDDSYLYEQAEAEQARAEEEGEEIIPWPCACGGSGWRGCDCEQAEEEEGEDDEDLFDLMAEREALRRQEQAKRDRPDWRAALEDNLTGRMINQEIGNG